MELACPFNISSLQYYNLLTVSSHRSWAYFFVEWDFDDGFQISTEPLFISFGFLAHFLLLPEPRFWLCLSTNAAAIISYQLSTRYVSVIVYRLYQLYFNDESFLCGKSEVTQHIHQRKKGAWGRDAKVVRNSKTYQTSTDRPTDGPTNWKVAYRVA